MDLIYFITVVAWPLACFFTLRFILSTAEITRYNSKAGELERLVDGIRGYQKVYKTGTKDALIALLSIAWLVVYYFG